jgi:hypothetical protein
VDERSFLMGGRHSALCSWGGWKSTGRPSWTMKQSGFNLGGLLQPLPFDLDTTPPPGGAWASRPAWHVIDRDETLPAQDAVWAVRAARCIPYTLHPAPYTLHPTLYTLNPEP